MTDEPLQFDHAETPDAAAGTGPTCLVCRQALTGTYFEAGGRTVCPECRTRFEVANVQGVAVSHFVRAILLGIVGAIGGALVYYAVLAATGYEVGLIAILVGFMVGYMVRLGAGGRGGRRYQLIAVLLTYLAIGATYVPIAVRAWSDADQAIEQAATPTALEGPGDTGSAVMAVGALAAFAAVLPILIIVDGFPGTLISALIIGFALHQAWRMNARLKVEFQGPFTVRPSAGGAAGT